MDHLFNDLGSVAQVAIVFGALIAFILHYERRVTATETTSSTHTADIADHEARIRTLEKAKFRA